jgi:hypothetical protein
MWHYAIRRTVLTLIALLLFAESAQSWSSSWRLRGRWHCSYKCASGTCPLFSSALFRASANLFLFLPARRGSFLRRVYHTLVVGRYKKSRFNSANSKSADSSRYFFKFFSMLYFWTLLSQRRLCLLCLHSVRGLSVFFLLRQIMLQLLTHPQLPYTIKF